MKAAREALARPGVRLDRYVAEATGWSRSMSQKAIRRGHVTLEGQDCRDPSLQVPEDAAVTVDGEPIVRLGRVVIALHKPLGVVSATEDRSERTVIDLLPTPLRLAEVRLAGRLDKDTTGLLILSNDGDLIHRLTHPRHHVEKEYVLSFDGVLDQPAQRFAQGLPLEDGTVCEAATFQALGEGRARIVLREGKYHQVRRMIAACGGHVTGLHRARVGGYTLPADLPEGEHRALTAQDEALLLARET